MDLRREIQNAFVTLRITEFILRVGIYINYDIIMNHKECKGEQ